MRNLLSDACHELNINISDVDLNNFIIYKDLLLEWNNKINLTAITEENEIALKHFIDCISVIKYRDFNEKSIIDVGTGAGFPGIPIKIMQNSSNMVLLDSLNKRLNFLNEVINKLNIKNINCIHMRAEEGGRNTDLREKFDFCVSRAVANLAVLSEYCIPYVKVGGEFIAFKGPNADNEILEAEKAINCLGAAIKDKKIINIPFTDIKHTIIFIEKLRQTPSKYPRKAIKIIKNPIK